MSESSKAVFLSYASQDAEAATRIADALRAAGIEVWFDQDELVGGDAWDGKIRKQIKECALFVPIISANTQARREGYFRLEWRLADQRTHLMSHDCAFLLPVVVDDTSDQDARVPESFFAVQWTRLPAGQTPAAFAGRVAALTIGKPPDTANGASRGVAHFQRDSERPTRGAPRGKWVAGIALVCSAVVVGVFSANRRGSETADRVPVSAPRPAAVEAAKYVERARSLAMSGAREQLALAEDFTRRATELDSASASAWAVRAMVHAGYVTGGIGGREQVRQHGRDAEAFAKRAVALQQDNVDAILALGQVQAILGDTAQAEKLYRRALELDPADIRVPRNLAALMRISRRTEEALPLLEEALRRAPNDGPLRCDLAGVRHSLGDTVGARRELEAALSRKVYVTPLLLKAGWAALEGDLVTMRDAVDRIPADERTEDRAIYHALWAGLLERRLDRVLNTARLTTRDYLENMVYTGPKGYMVALALQAEGRQNQARTEWEKVEALLRDRLRREPGDSMDQVFLSIALVSLARGEEATRIMAPIEAAWQERLLGGNARRLAWYYAAAGDGAKVATYVRAAKTNRSIDLETPVDLRRHPRWDKVRTHPDFVALLAEMENATSARGATSTASAAESKALPVEDGKSVAVLAFVNLSDDKANEIFSDGISEELINVLGRVPGLTVKGRASSFYFKGNPATAQEKGQKLGAAYLVDGSVRKSGNTVRITARLSRAATDELVWSSEPLVRELKDVWAVQEEIAGLIAKALSLKLGAASPASKTAVNPQVFELYLQGRQAWNLRTTAGYDRAEELFKRALAIDSNYARAHAALADVWLMRGQDSGVVGRFDSRASPEQAQIVAKAREALALDPNSAEAHASLGLALRQGWNWQEGEQALRRAIALNPNYASAHQWLGRGLVNNGRVDEGLAELRMAADLDPLSSRILDNYALGLLRVGRLTEALEVYERALSVQPGAIQALRDKAWVLAELGRREEAATMVRALPTNNPISRLDQGLILARAGLRSEAEAMLSGLDSKVGASDRARLLLALDRHEEGLRALDAGGIEVNSLEQWLFASFVDPIRNEPRFAKFLADLGLTEAHARGQAWRAAHPPEKAAQK